MNIGLLILRGAAVFLALTLGRQKLLAFVVFMRSGLPLGSLVLANFLEVLDFPRPGC